MGIMILCSDGKIRLCDFADSKSEERETHSHHVVCSAILGKTWKGPPDKENDVSTLWISIWKLFAGRRPTDDKDERTIFTWTRGGHVVDLDEISDEEALKTVNALMSPKLGRLSEDNSVMSLQG